jgi:hypothetical protein
VPVPFTGGSSFTPSAPYGFAALLFGLGLFLFLIVAGLLASRRRRKV